MDHSGLSWQLALGAFSRQLKHVLSQCKVGEMIVITDLRYS